PPRPPPSSGSAATAGAPASVPPAGAGHGPAPFRRLALPPFFHPSSRKPSGGRVAIRVVRASVAETRNSLTHMPVKGGRQVKVDRAGTRMQDGSKAGGTLVGGRSRAAAPWAAGPGVR